MKEAGKVYAGSGASATARVTCNNRRNGIILPALECELKLDILNKFETFSPS